MLKVPTFQCSFEHHHTSRTVFLGKYELPLWKAHVLRQKCTPRVERPEGGLPAGNYWREFYDIDAEYNRMLTLYGASAVGAAYPTMDDFIDVINEALMSVAQLEGRNPHAPVEIIAEPIIVQLCEGIAGVTAEEALIMATDFATLGITSIEDVATAAISKLCSAKLVGPATASKLMRAAKAIVESNTASDKASKKASKKATGNQQEGPALDLGVLAGRTLTEE